MAFVNEGVPVLTARAVRRYLDRGMDQQSAINAALADSRKGVTPLAFKAGRSGSLPSVEGAKPDRAKSRDLEHVEQRELFKRIRAFEVEIPVLAFVHAVPNGGARSKATAGKLWAEGVRPGPPDIYLDAARRGFHGFRGELKAPGNVARTSDDQRRWHEQLRREGYFVTVQDTWESMWGVLVWYLDLGLDRAER